jgi:hypothetical protein
VDAALLQLIGYHQNRDHQLEAMCVKGLKRHLEASGWLDIQELESFNIYYMMDRSRDSCCAEWEGGVIANDPDLGVFLVDSSKKMDLKKVNSCRDRFLRTIKHTDPSKVPEANIPLLHTKQRFLREVRHLCDARLHCYIGGTVINKDAMSLSATLNYGVIQQHEDNFVVVRFVCS